MDCCAWHSSSDTDTISDPGVVPHECGNIDVGAEVCGGNRSAGTVWMLDLSMKRLNCSLSSVVLDALKVLTGYGLHTMDFSR